MTATSPIIRRVDRILLRTPDPSLLFYLFAHDLGLPIAWPVITGPFLTSGGIRCGSLDVEIMQVGTQAASGQLYGIVFELQPPEICLPALAERGLPYATSLPYFGWREYGEHGELPSSVYLGDLLGNNLWLRGLFSLSRLVPRSTWQRVVTPEPLHRNTLLSMILNRACAEGLALGVTSQRGQGAPPQIAAISPEERLHVTGIVEVLVGVKNYQRACERWERLLSPAPQVEAGCWLLEDDLLIRLTPHAQNGLLAFTWRVRSLDEAQGFLVERNLLGRFSGGYLSLAKEKIYGLDIRLVE